MNTLSINNILFFDEECILCNKSIRFIHFLDIHKRIYFGPLQSEQGISIQNELQLTETLSTVVYFKEGKLYTKSSAIIHCLADIHWFLKPILFFLLIPTFIRNQIYDFIATNRKRIFRDQSCEIPSESLKKQIL